MKLKPIFCCFPPFLFGLQVCIYVALCTHFFFAKKAMRKIGKIGDKRGKIVLPLCCYIPILYIYNILKKKKNIFSYYVENLCKYVGNIHICKYLFMEMCIHIHSVFLYYCTSIFHLTLMSHAGVYNFQKSQLFMVLNSFESYHALSYYFYSMRNILLKYSKSFNIGM